MGANFQLAPPSKTVDGLLSVPIDIESINAVFIIDGATPTATADATIVYTVGCGYREVDTASDQGPSRDL